MSKLEPIEVKDFLIQLLEDINDAVNKTGTSVVGDIEVDMTIQKVSTVGGDVKIYVLSGGTKTGQENTSKVHFNLRPKDSERTLNIIAETIRSNSEQKDRWDLN